MEFQWVPHGSVEWFEGASDRRRICSIYCIGIMLGWVYAVFEGGVL